MHLLHPDDKEHDVFEHLKSNWAESIILLIFCVAIVCLVLGSSIANG